MFGYGYDQDITDVFLSGTRVLSIASPLLSYPYVHDYKTGPSGIGIQMHDGYHFLVEAGNCYIRECTHLAKLLQDKYASYQGPYQHVIKTYIDYILDREFYQTGSNGYHDGLPSYLFRFFESSASPRFSSEDWEFYAELHQAVWDLLQEDPLLQPFIDEWCEVDRRYRMKEMAAEKLPEPVNDDFFEKLLLEF